MITINSTFSGQGYWAECTECDWTGTARATQGEAWADGNAHICSADEAR
jgi:hypothetical protein